MRGTPREGDSPKLERPRASLREKQVLMDSQQGNRGLSPTATRNGILPTSRTALEVDSSTVEPLCENTDLLPPGFQPLRP